VPGSPLILSFFTRNDPSFSDIVLDHTATFVSCCGRERKGSTSAIASNGAVMWIDSLGKNSRRS